jgi:hypothetical protein
MLLCRLNRNKFSGKVRSSNASLRIRATRIGLGVRPSISMPRVCKQPKTSGATVAVASQLPQVEPGESENCAALLPFKDSPVIDVAPGLVRVAVLATLVFVVWVPKLRLDGAKSARKRSLPSLSLAPPWPLWLKRWSDWLPGRSNWRKRSPARRGVSVTAEFALWFPVPAATVPPGPLLSSSSTPIGYLGVSTTPWIPVLSW